MKLFQIMGISEEEEFEDDELLIIIMEEIKRMVPLMVACVIGMAVSSYLAIIKNGYVVTKYDQEIYNLFKHFSAGRHILTLPVLGYVSFVISYYLWECLGAKVEKGNGYIEEGMCEPLTLMNASLEMLRGVVVIIGCYAMFTLM